MIRTLLTIGLIRLAMMTTKHGFTVDYLELAEQVELNRL